MYIDTVTMMMNFSPETGNGITPRRDGTIVGFG
jgi:hypothetical protein